MVSIYSYLTLVCVVICAVDCASLKAKSLCFLPPSPTTAQLVEYRLCQTAGLARADPHGLSGRASGIDGEESDLKKKQSATLEAVLNADSTEANTDTTNINSFMTIQAKSLLCAGLSLKQCQERLKKYEEWKKVKGVGIDKGRWERSTDPHDHSMQAIIARYRQWRNQHGYGRPYGRWGRSVDAARQNDVTETREKSPLLRRLRKRRRAASHEEYYRLLKEYQNWRERYGYGRHIGRWG